MAHLAAPVTIKRFAHQRLYAPAAGPGMVEDEEVFVVLEAASGENVTPSILKQIIIERARHG
jgi:polyhydroxyalkanoate synthesis regulator protein